MTRASAEVLSSSAWKPGLYSMYWVGSNVAYFPVSSVVRSPSNLEMKSFLISSLSDGVVCVGVVGSGVSGVWGGGERGVLSGRGGSFPGRAVVLGVSEPAVSQDGHGFSLALEVVSTVLVWVASDSASILPFG